MLNREKISEFRRNAIETINPAAKEKRLIGEIQNNLGRLNSLLTGQDIKSGSGTAKDVASIINRTKQTLFELQQTNEKLDLGANLSHLIQSLIPLAEKPSPTWAPPAKECPTN